MISYCLNKQTLLEKDIEVSANYGGQDIFLIVPFLTEHLYYNVLTKQLCNHNESLYTKWFFTGKFIINEETELKNCEVSVIPFKYKDTDKRVEEICNNAKNHNKRVVAFFTDDADTSYALPENLFLFRTSTNKSTIQKNERVMPALHPDHFSGLVDCKASVSFCGQLTELRYNIINALRLQNIDTDFIIRQGFWAPETGSKVKARKQYYENLLNNRYALCIRGSGNFSFRFYEALCFGRIPILLDTDTVLPFEHIIDWEKHIIRIKESEISNLSKHIANDTRSMENNRKLWETWFSVEGYAKNFIKEIKP